MHVATAAQAEIRFTIETLFEVVNGLDRPETDTRSVLIAAGFSRASEASTASLGRLESRLTELAPLLTGLPDMTTGDATRRVNEELTELPIAPSVADHDGVGPHMHWTPSTARFDDQVLADLFMALAQELCDNGTDRFGRCGAADCDDIFYDATRNHSKRFCADPKCASRTHTADHRARRRSETMA